MTEICPPFWSSFSSYSDDKEPREIEAMRSKLPSRILALAESDVWAVLSHTYDSISSALSPYFSRKYELELDEHLRKTVQLLEKLRGHVAEISELTFNGSLNFRQSWLAQMFGVHLERTREGHTVQIPVSQTSPNGEWVTPEKALYMMEITARDILRARKMEVAHNRPREQILLAVCYTLARAWAAFELMLGAKVPDSFPTGRNEGFRWCIEVVALISSRTILEENMLGARTDGTIKASVRKSVDQLKGRLISTPLIEAEQKWASLSWDSNCGLEILFCAVCPPSPDCFLKQSNVLHSYYPAMQEWLHRDKSGAPPTWVDD